MIQVLVLAMAVIIAIGGFLAILGGIAIFRGHKTMGKMLIALGGGIGFFGIAFSVGYNVYAHGPQVIVARIDYWIGVLLASFGRYLAKYA